MATWASNKQYPEKLKIFKSIFLRKVICLDLLIEKIDALVFNSYIELPILLEDNVYTEKHEKQMSSFLDKYDKEN